MRKFVDERFTAFISGKRRVDAQWFSTQTQAVQRLTAPRIPKVFYETDPPGFQQEKEFSQYFVSDLRPYRWFVKQVPRPYFFHALPPSLTRSITY